MQHPAIGHDDAKSAVTFREMRTLLLKRAVLHADETPVQQLDPGNGKTKRAYLRHILGCIADHPINRVEELLPWNVAASLPDVLRLAA